MCYIIILYLSGTDDWIHAVTDIYDKLLYAKLAEVLQSNNWKSKTKN